MDDFGTSLNVICLETKAFKALVSEVAQQLKGEFFQHLNPWISEDEAMEMLNIRAKGTMKKYRDEGKLDYRKPEGAKKIYYNRQSIIEFIENSPK